LIVKSFHLDINKVFDNFDLNNDGLLSKEEFSNILDIIDDLYSEE
jgi:Ca2+-binding EF-hand superfamily protein